MRRSLVVLFAFTALTLAGAACSSGGGGGGGGGGGATSSTGGGSTTGGASTGAGASGGCTAASAQDLSGGTVTIKSFAYSPDCFSASASAGVKVTNDDSVPHTFTVTGTAVDQELDGGHTASIDLSGIAPGTYQFHCLIHPTMTGTLIVS